jgi:hypothetical protein
MGGGGRGLTVTTLHTWYALANLECFCMAMTPMDSWVMGCMSLGSELMTLRTPEGSLERSNSSTRTLSASAAVGTSPVSSSHSRPSGRGSASTLGSTFCSSGMEWPRKAMPCPKRWQEGGEAS